MGRAVSFVGFRGVEAERVHKLLSLKRAQANSGFLKAPITAAVLPAGWYVVFFNGKQFRRFNRRALTQIGNGSEVCHGFIDERVMCSAISSWVNGREAWSVEHNGQHGRHHLDALGALPKEFEAIRERQFVLQEAETRDDVDHLIEIPMDLGRHVLGFTLERGVDGHPEHSFEVFEEEKKKKWFGIF